MAGDYTRFRYNPLKNTTGVQMQQGRVLLDQDWNEYVQLQDRRWRAETMDIMGRAVVPIDTKTAFELDIAGTSFTIGIGRMYVDGLQAENHGVDPLDPTKRVYDPILGELVGKAAVPYEQQPYYPNPPAFPADGNPHLVYLDVWEREVTYLDDPKLIDQAVAVDTATLVQTVWQVKVLANTPAGSTCSTAPGTIPGWVSATAPSAGRLTTAAAGVPSSTDPCIVPPNGGYRGSGNRCYRVEVHTAGPMGTAQFKWSRDNASVASHVTGINAGLDTLTVVLTRRDSVLRFQPNDWVEVTDDFRYFQGLPGEMRQVAAVNDANLTIQLKTALPAGEFDATKPERHLRVIRWDQQGIVRDPLGNQIIDVDSNGGLIPVPAAGTTLVLEDGIQITFSIDAAMPEPNFNALDYWMFAARVIDASVDILTQAPPRGILHHYAWLGFVTLPGGPATSCRIFWPPATGDGGCDCTVCVSAASHNNNILTIQSAVNQVEGLGGGKVCLGPGIYNITSTITVTGDAAVEISGHGLPTLVAATGFAAQSPMLLIDSTVNIIVEDLAFFGPAAAIGANQTYIPGVVISNSSFVRILRCVFSGTPSHTKAGGAVSLSPAIGMTGSVSSTQIRDNVFANVGVGVGSSSNQTAASLFYSSITNNEMACTQAGLSFADPKNVPSFVEVSFADNLVAGPVGFEFNGSGLGVSIERNWFEVASSVSAVYAVSPMYSAPVMAAIICNASDCRIANNRIVGTLQSTANYAATQNGIVLAGSTIAGVQITGNQISGLTANGIVVKQGTTLAETIISQNQIGNMGGAGILSETGSYAIDLDIVGNVIASVGLTGSDANAGILLLAASNVNLKIGENVVETVGQSSQTGLVFGIWVTLVSDVRITGNRIVDVGPIGSVTLGVGIALILVAGRVDVVDNEVRRANTTPFNGDPSPWSALLIERVAGDVSIQGNRLESFGSIPTVEVLSANSCKFCDNQCILDNLSTGRLSIIVVQLGRTDALNAGAMIVSNNLIQSGASGNSKQAVMNLWPTNTGALTVLGNLATGGITVGVAALAAPWAPLNVQG